MARKWYKVVNTTGRTHIAGFQYSLPKDDKPGEWHELAKNIALAPCVSGFHITDRPAYYVTRNKDIFSTVYEVEFQGEALPYNSTFCYLTCRKVRLVRKLEDNELSTVGIFSTGSHVCKLPYMVATGDARVLFYGKWALAFNSAKLRCVAPMDYISVCDDSQAHLTSSILGTIFRVYSPTARITYKNDVTEGNLRRPKWSKSGTSPTTILTRRGSKPMKN